MIGRWGLALVVCGACGSTADPAGTGTTGSATSSTSIDPTSEVTSGASSSGDESTSDVTPVDLPPPPEPKSCALETVDPDADPTMVIDAGDGEGQIPTVVGDALLRNCGCHYNTNMLMVGSGYIDYDEEIMPLATHADWHVDFTGTFPTGYEMMPTYLAVEQRVVFSDPLPMPPFGCVMISDADLALLADWLGEGAPDGASYMGG